MKAQLPCLSGWPISSIDVPPVFEAITTTSTPARVLASCYLTAASMEAKSAPRA